MTSSKRPSSVTAVTSFELARRAGASYGVNAGDEVAFERHPLRDGDQFTAGGLRIRVIATPGHTPTHLAYLIEDGHDDAALFTGAPCCSAWSDVPI